MTSSQRLSWGVLFALFALYAAGFLLGWGERAPWHLLLVIVAILFLYNVFNIISRRG
ncbi:MAG: hypothetical protein ABI670_19415 [Chloroflexota bacterium]